MYRVTLKKRKKLSGFTLKTNSWSDIYTSSQSVTCSLRLSGKCCILSCRVLLSRISNTWVIRGCFSDGPRLFLRVCNSRPFSPQTYGLTLREINLEACMACVFF